jgi:site-specific DNA recombinase
LLVPGEHANLVRRIFALYVEGLGVRSIVKTLNDQGVRTPRGSTWATHSVSHILQNPIYAGFVRYGHRMANGRLNKGSASKGPEVMMPGQHTPIIDAGLWEQAQTVMARRKTIPSRQSTGDYPLTGIARCGLCGSAMSGLRRIHGRTTRVWRREYRCVGRIHRATCTLQAMLANKVEEIFLRAVEQCAEPEMLHAMLAPYAPSADEEQRADEIRKQLKEIEKRIVRWDAAYEKGTMSLEKYDEKTTPLTKEQTHLTEQLKTLTTPATYVTAEALVKLASNIRERWNQAEPAQRKALVHEWFSCVKLYPGYNVVLVLR